MSPEPSDTDPHIAAAIAWIVRRNGEEWTAAEQAELAAWLAADPAHAAAYREIERLWWLLGACFGRPPLARGRRPH